MTTYRQIFKSTGLLGSVQVLSIAISVVRNKVAALLIGAAGMGLADLYSRTLDLVGSGTNFGLGLSAIKQIAAGYDPARPAAPRTLRLVRLVRSWVALTALFGILAGLALSPLLSRWAMGDALHTSAFALLAPAVGFATLTGGEMALLKATRQLKSLACATVGGAAATLLLSTVIYLGWGTRGIPALLLLSSAALYGCYLRESVRRYPLRTGPWRKRFLRCGAPMLRLGTAYLIAGVMTAGAEMLVRTDLYRSGGGPATVGLYAAGLTLTVSYAQIIFSALGADFLPRLIATDGDRRAANLTINRQINALAVLMCPFLIAFCLALPLIVRLLYTADFLSIVPMVVCAAPYMYFKAIYTPIASLPLARGHSVLFLVMELSYDVVFCLLVITGYRLLGLTGAGIALSIANLCDLCMVWGIYHRRYGYRMSRSTLLRCALLAGLLCIGLAGAAQGPLLPRLGIGLPALLLTLPAAWPVLKKLRK